jgi:hypothetical protein
MEDQKQQDRIRRRAYELWEREGSPDGRAEEFWQRAIATLESDAAQGIAGDQEMAPEANAAATSSKSKHDASAATGK